MKISILIWCFTCVFVSILRPAYAAGAINTLAVIDPQAKTEFEAGRKPQLEARMRDCPNCQLLNITPYNADGRFDAALLTRQLDQVPRENSVVLFLWNKAWEPKDEELKGKIKSLLASGVLVVATAGRPEPQGPTLGLKRTLWGQIPEAVIIGELTERERLKPGTFFGPEMLTAIRPPSDVMGQDAAALMFSTRLVSQLRDKKSNEWVEFLRNKKATSRRMWPTLDEFFGR